MASWLTDSLAVLGAVTGTVSLILNLRSAHKDRVRLKLKAGVVVRFTPATGRKRFVEVEVLNQGRRTAKIVEVGVRPCVEELPGIGSAEKPIGEGKLKFLGTHFFMFRGTGNEAVSLGENENQLFSEEITDSMAASFLDGRGIAFLTDSLGNEHKVLFSIPRGSA